MIAVQRVASVECRVPHTPEPHVHQHWNELHRIDDQHAVVQRKSRQEYHQSDVDQAAEYHPGQEPAQNSENTGHAWSVPGAAGEKVVVLLDLAWSEKRHYFFQRGVG